MAIGASMLVSASQGIAHGQSRMLAASERMLAGVEPVDVVEHKLGQAQILVSAALARSYDELLGSLVDTLA